MIIYAQIPKWTNQALAVEKLFVCGFKFHFIKHLETVYSVSPSKKHSSRQRSEVVISQIFREVVHFV